jgi:hypothetical protein
MTATANPLTGAAPTAVEMFYPEGDEGSQHPDVSIVIPAMNEEITVGEFINWCKEGLAKAGVRGEIIIVDSSTDRTAQIALDSGARVLRVPKRGLGRAYIDAIPYVRADFVILGDCDLTYDFRDLTPFIDRYREGCEFVMGSRFMGSIEPGAMPPLHRYFGSPLTTWAFNVVNRTRFSDIHCGMRGITLDLWKRLELTSQGWEYASEMIAKVNALHAKSTDVPIKFYKDREGRISHLAGRSGWRTPWMAGWDTLRITFTFGAEHVLIPLAAIFMLAGGALSLLLSMGPVTVLPGMRWTLNALYFGVMLFICGVALLQFAVLAAVVNDRLSGVQIRWVRRIPYTPSIVFGAALLFVGVIPPIVLVARYAENHFVIMPNDVVLTHLSTIGLGLLVVGILQLSFTLLLHSLLDRLYHN